MSNIEYKPFKISDLPSIENIESRDLFLVSDYEGGKCYSRRMSVGQFTQCDPVKSAISAEVSSQMREDIDARISSFIQRNFMALLSSHWTEVFDLIDGRQDNSMVIGQNTGA